jgi:hypothetical protein
MTVLVTRLQTRIPVASKNYPLNRNSFRVLLIGAVLVTALITGACAKIETAYLTNYPYFWDPAAYYQINMRLAFAVHQKGPLKAAAADLYANKRDPFRTAPIVLFAPAMLETPLGHLSTAVPLLFAFVFLFGIAIYGRTGNVLYAIAAILTVGALPGMYNPENGFCAYWLDLPAAFSMGAAALCLINFGSSAKLKWLVLFGAFASITAMSRFTAAFYLILFAVPLLAWQLLRNWRFQHSVTEAITEPLLAVASTSIVGLIFIFRFLAENADYYRTYGYAFDSSVSQSIHWTFFVIHQFMGTPTLSLCCVLILSNAIWMVRGKSGKHSLELFLASTWFPLAISIFLCCIVRAVNGYQPVLYLVPALLIAAFATDSFVSTTRRATIAFSSVLLCLSLISGIQGYEAAYKHARHPAPDKVAQKQMDKTLATLIIDKRATSFVEFDQESITPALEAFFARGWYCASHSQYFTVHEAYWKGWYPGLTPEEVAVAVYSDMPKNIRLVCVHNRVEDIARNPLLDNGYSRIVSAYISERIRSDQHWTLLRTLASPHGELAVYENVEFHAGSHPFNNPPGTSRI